MNMIEPAKAPSPKFFRILRSIDLALLALSGSFIASPVVLPTVVVSVTGYLAVAGAVLSAVSQMTVDVDAKAEEDLLNRMRKNNENLPRDAIK
ncbi:MAG: hypothetical protein ACI9L6_001166 [Flavobacterium sp.]|jgi:hypothetical protein